MLWVRLSRVEQSICTLESFGIFNRRLLGPFRRRVERSTCQSLDFNRQNETGNNCTEDVDKKFV